MAVKGVILVGGPSRGTRFRPISLYNPKPLFPIAGTPAPCARARATQPSPGSFPLGLPMIAHQIRALSSGQADS